MSRNYDNWDRLVKAVLKREQIRQLCHQDSVSSISSSICTLDDFSAYTKLDLAQPHSVQSLGPISLGRHQMINSYELVRQLGKGEFGTTYLVWLSKHVHPYSGRAVIKSLINTVDISENEFKQHMIELGKCSYQYVRTPWAYYYSQKQKIIFYDYHTQGSVFDMLQAGRGRWPSWQSRMKIAAGAALGVAHLHRRDLFHGNIKSSNIFPNRTGYGCVSEFGLAGIMERSRPSEKSDVYSFGLLLLELFTGGQASLDNRAIRYFDSSYNGLVDEMDMREAKIFWFPHVDRQQFKITLQKTSRLAESCLDVLPENRPSMYDVVLNLKNIADFVGTLI